MQVALGAVYAWSVFRVPLSEHFDTTVARVNLIFSLSILFLGFAAYFGGLWMGKSGPRRVGMAAGILYGLGIILTGISSSSIVLLYLTYGVLAGIGIGLGYIVPVATLIKWFPDRRGFITGIAVAGFGAGALVTAPIAQRLIDGVGLFETFIFLGVAYLVVVTGAAATLSNPPEGWKPAGWEPDTRERSDRSGVDYDLRGALRTWQWFALWRSCSSTSRPASRSSRRPRRSRRRSPASARSRPPAWSASSRSATRSVASAGRGCRTRSGASGSSS